MPTILLKILSVLPWGTIIEFILGRMKDKPVEPGDDKSDEKVKKPSTHSTWSSKVWLMKARSQIGIKEIYGKRHHPQILKYHAETSLKATTDEVPWCSSYVCWVLEKTGIKSTRSARARSYEKWGMATDKRIGAIVVFWRTSLKSGNGHVGFYMGEGSRPGYIKVLGGNQSNAVNIKEYPEDRVLGYRWPVDS